jgi:uncharacterized protein (TIGR02646 family)
MIFLDRMTINVPANWQEQVHKKLPDLEAYTRKAREFESLPISDNRRRAGFIIYVTTYTPEVLPKSRGKAIFPAVWRSDKRVKKTFDAWSQGKCAYCESLINASRSQQVEHFKPKSLFPSLAYDWANYFLSCNGCNGAKLDKWPEAGDYIRPDRGQPEMLFVFDDQGGMKAVQADSEAQRTVDDFELDRSGLRRARQVAIRQQLATMSDLINQRGLQVVDKRRFVQRMVERAENPKIPYSQALGQNLRRLWQEHFPHVSLF